jgi:hypothetical protein
MSRRHNPLILTCIAVVFLGSSLYAAFRDIGWGVRPAAMAGAYTAVSNDSNGILYNPAGISRCPVSEINLMYSRLFTGLDDVRIGMNYAAFIHHFAGFGSIGLNWAGLFSYDQYREDTVSISFSKKMDDYIKRHINKNIASEISVGINMKYLIHTFVLDERTEDDPVFAGGNSKGNISFDMGFWMRPHPGLVPGLVTAAVFKNINRPDMGLESEDRVPLESRFGVSYVFDTWRFFEDILIDIDMTYRGQSWGKFGDKANLQAGIEAWIMDGLFAIRAGKNSTELTSGIGLNTSDRLILDICVDYAFIWPAYIKDTFGSHRISVVYKFK